VINAYIEHEHHGWVLDSGGDGKRFGFYQLPRIGETIFVEQFKKDTVVTGISWHVGWKTEYPNDVTINVKDNED
jgi:hypothetical protein